MRELSLKPNLVHLSKFLWFQILMLLEMTYLIWSDKQRNLFRSAHFSNKDNTIVTTRIRRIGKVMFSQVCVRPWGEGVPTLASSRQMKGVPQGTYSSEPGHNGGTPRYLPPSQVRTGGGGTQRYLSPPWPGQDRGRG